MAGGDVFSATDRYEIDKAIRDAETVCRYEFSVFVGPSIGSSRRFAERLHSALVAPERSVFVLVDPVLRAVEVVTGEEVRRDLEDSEVHLAVLSMQTAFAADDVAGGIKQGVMMLAQHARRPPMLHVD